MAKRFDSVDDLLCLTGSQLGYATPSSRQNSVSKTQGRPSSSSGASSRVKPRTKKSGDSVASLTDRTKNFTSGQPTKIGSHSEFGDTNCKSTNGKQSDRGDYLDFFEVSHQPKIIQPKQTVKSNTKAAGTKGHSQFTHSVFQPISARTVSTVEDLDLSDGENVLNTRNKVDLESKNNNFDSLVTSGRFNSGAFPTDTTDRDGQSRSYRAGLNSGAASAKDPEGQSRSSAFSQKFKSNGVANNMTSQALHSGNKAPLTSMENAYQNIKHKTPVNQVRQKTSTNLAEDYIKLCNMNVIKIQRWFRRWSAKRRNAEVSMKQLLEAKRQERELAMSNDRKKELSRDVERKKSREEKARVARQNAMQELQKRREEKQQFQQKIAEEEIAFLQANGKITKKSSNLKKMELNRSNSHQLSNAATGQDLRQRPGSATGQHNSAGKASQRQRGNSAESRNQTQLIESNIADAVKQDRESMAASSTTSDSRTKTTIDDILETLRKLGVEDEVEGAAKKTTSGRLEWLDELEKNEYRSDFVDNDPSEDQPRSNPSKDNISQSGLLSEEKLSNIMDYLIKMETNDRLTDIDLELQKVNETLDKPALLVPSSEEIAQMELASQTASEVTQQMLNMRLELEEKKRKVHTVEKALNQQRDLTVRYAKETESEMKKRLEGQRQQFDVELSRRNCLIDQLLEDKKQWAEKYDTLHKQLVTVTQTSRDKIKSMEDSHAVEVKKLTDLHAATEKLRREKWVKEETKKKKVPTATLR